MTNDGITHQKLLEIVPKRPADYEPWGEVIRWADDDEAYPDCSMGCVFAAWLEGALRFDWCVCTNPASHRTGFLLTLSEPNARFCHHDVRTLRAVSVLRQKAP